MFTKFASNLNESQRLLTLSSHFCFATSSTLRLAKLPLTSSRTLLLSVKMGDITEEVADAIVNAANSELRHGGGLAAAIVKKGGKAIQNESDEYVQANGPIPTGKVAVTGPGSMWCKKVIHAVGPVWKGGVKNEKELLKEATLNSIQQANDLGLKSIALPAISSGIYGFPKPLCAQIMFQAVLELQKEIQSGTRAVGTVEDIRFVNFDTPTVDVFVKEFDILGFKQ
ncbi:hypothetical protein FGO68_gene14479 [Halteria grandinella]|uniref:Macro domain-containing protein n=1 Tax=Halteria grandinella TaxID=5974 RepID=A0A8J8NIB7_HALGN|nr:hypothetical protein FGO68_gene14479 [Halteria grandinella]